MPKVSLCLAILSFYQANCISVMGNIVRLVNSVGGNPLSYFLNYEMFSLIGSKVMQNIIAMGRHSVRPQRLEIS